MRKLVLLASLLTLASMCLTAPRGYAQSNSSSYRPTGGWKASPAATPRGQSNSTFQGATAPVQSAFYQAANPPSLPGFPGDAYGTGSTSSGNAGVVLPPNLPSMPNALSAGPLGNAQSYPPTAQGYPLTNPPQFTGQPNQPASGLTQYNADPYNPAQYGQAVSGQSQPLQPTATYPQSDYSQQNYPQQIYPQFNRQPFQTVATGRELRAVEPSVERGTGSQLRATSPSLQTGFGPNLQAQQIATGLPYVTPAPRTGRYPTSPYNSGQFQTVSYQSGSQPLNAFNNQPPLNTANIANSQPVLPQNQPAAIYPTAYQQCAPGLAPPTLPPNLSMGTYSPNNSGYKPLFSLGQENYNVMLGRGLIGQPTVYVPSQPIRNFLRYIFP